MLIRMSSKIGCRIQNSPAPVWPANPEETMMPRKVCFSMSWSTIALLAMSMLFGVAHAAQRELKEVRVAYPPSMASVTLMTGIKQKFFEEQGLTPTLLVIASDLALKSQVAGGVGYRLFAGGTGMVAAAAGVRSRVLLLA